MLISMQRSRLCIFVLQFYLPQGSLSLNLEMRWLLDAMLVDDDWCSCIKLPRYKKIYDLLVICFSWSLAILPLHFFSGTAFMIFCELQPTSAVTVFLCYTIPHQALLTRSFGILLVLFSRTNWAHLALRLLQIFSPFVAAICTTVRS